LQDVGIALSINIAMPVALSVKSCQEFPMRPSHALIAILPCNDLDASEAFYNRLGFTRPDS